MEKQIDYNKLTVEAEAGHGKFVQDALKGISFNEQIKILNQVETLSRQHHTADRPLVTYDHWKNEKGNDEIVIGLKRSTRQFLTFDNGVNIYQNHLDMTTGKQSVTIPESKPTATEMLAQSDVTRDVIVPPAKATSPTVRTWTTAHR